MLAGRCVSEVSHNVKSSMTSSSLSSGLTLVAGAVNAFLSPQTSLSTIIPGDSAELQLHVKGHITMTPAVKSVPKVQQQAQQQLILLRPVTAQPGGVQYGVVPQGSATAQVVSSQLPTSVQMLPSQPSTTVHMVAQQPAANVQLMTPQSSAIFESPMPHAKPQVSRAVFVPVAATAEVVATPTRPVHPQAQVAFLPHQVMHQRIPTSTFFESPSSVVQVAETAKGFAVNLNNFLTVTGEFDLSSLCQHVRQLAAQHGGLKGLRLSGSAELLEELLPYLEQPDWARRLLAKYEGLSAMTVLGEDAEVRAHLLKMFKRGLIDLKSPGLSSTMTDRVMDFREHVKQSLGQEAAPAQEPVVVQQQAPAATLFRWQRAGRGGDVSRSDETSASSESTSGSSESD